jgi:hypothetical protein
VQCRLLALHQKLSELLSGTGKQKIIPVGWVTRQAASRYHCERNGVMGEWNGICTAALKGLDVLFDRLLHATLHNLGDLFVHGLGFLHLLSDINKLI